MSDVINWLVSALKSNYVTCRFDDLIITSHYLLMTLDLNKTQSLSNFGYLITGQIYPSLHLDPIIDSNEGNANDMMKDFRWIKIGELQTFILLITETLNYTKDFSHKILREETAIFLLYMC